MYVDESHEHRDFTFTVQSVKSKHTKSFMIIINDGDLNWTCSGFETKQEAIDKAKEYIDEHIVPAAA